VDEDLSGRLEAADELQPTNGHQAARAAQSEDIATLPGEPAPDVHASQHDGIPDSEQIDDPPSPVSEHIPDREYDEGAAAARTRVLGGLRELAETVILALIFFFALRAVVQNFRVEGSSMVPSFTDGQYVLVNKAVYAHADSGTLPSWVPLLGGGSGAARYLFHPPERGDVIVFHPPPPNDPSRDFIKRVIGVPGDTVDVRQGHVYVNGEELTEPYIQQATLPINVRFAHVVLGPDQFYVLGDNRGNSSDSRAWGPVSSDEIVGRTWLVYWPLSAVKVAPNHSEHAAPPQTVPTTP
jgi:signal peptidase I